MTAVEPDVCPNCRARPGTGHRYCEACGTDLGPGPERAEPGRDPTGRVEVDAGLAAAVSDRGRIRTRNEDAVWLTVHDDQIIVVVADGVSTSRDAARASQVAVDTAGPVIRAGLATDPPARVLTDALLRANTAVTALDQDAPGSPVAPACVIVAAVVSMTGPEITVGWAGDSRAYWVPAAGPALPLTADDSFAAELVALGADPAIVYDLPNAHVITAWLGADMRAPRNHLATHRPDGPGTLLLCSDGLWNYLVDPTYLATAVRATATDDPATPAAVLRQARALTALACAAGGHDNITVALVPIPTRPGDSR